MAATASNVTCSDSRTSNKPLDLGGKINFPISPVPNTKKVWPTSPDDYILERKLTSNPKFAIFAAYCIPLKEKCSIKLTPMEKYFDPTQHQMQVWLMTAWSHRNLLSCYSAFQVGRSVWIVTKLLTRGSLSDIIKNKRGEKENLRGVIKQDDIAYVVKEILHGLDYLHRNGWVHRDIRSSNIYIDENGYITIGGLDKCERLPKLGLFDLTLPKVVDEMYWTAPEVIRRKEQLLYEVTKCRMERVSSDIWSVGILMLEMVTGYPPVHSLKTFGDVVRNIGFKNSPSLKKLEHAKGQYDHYSQNFVDLIDVCLKKHARSRPNAFELLQNSFLISSSSNNHFMKLVTNFSPMWDFEIDIRELESIIRERAKAKQKKEEIVPITGAITDVKPPTPKNAAISKEECTSTEKLAILEDSSKICKLCSRPEGKKLKKLYPGETFERVIIPATCIRKVSQCIGVDETMLRVPCQLSRSTEVEEMMFGSARQVLEFETYNRKMSKSTSVSDFVVKKSKVTRSLEMVTPETLRQKSSATVQYTPSSIVSRKVSYSTEVIETVSPVAETILMQTNDQQISDVAEPEPVTLEITSPSDIPTVVRTISQTVEITTEKSNFPLLKKQAIRIAEVTKNAFNYLLVKDQQKHKYASRKKSSLSAVSETKRASKGLLNDSDLSELPDKNDFREDSINDVSMGSESLHVSLKNSPAGSLTANMGSLYSTKGLHDNNSCISSSAFSPNRQKDVSFIVKKKSKSYVKKNENQSLVHLESDETLLGVESSTRISIPPSSSTTKSVQGGKPKHGNASSTQGVPSKERQKSLESAGKARSSINDQQHESNVKGILTNTYSDTIQIVPVQTRSIPITGRSKERQDDANSMKGSETHYTSELLDPAVETQDATEVTEQATTSNQDQTNVKYRTSHAKIDNVSFPVLFGENCRDGEESFHTLTDHKKNKVNANIFHLIYEERNLEGNLLGSCHLLYNADKDSPVLLANFMADEQIITPKEVAAMEYGLAMLPKRAVPCTRAKFCLICWPTDESPHYSTEPLFSIVLSLKTDDMILQEVWIVMFTAEVPQIDVENIIEMICRYGYIQIADVPQTSNKLAEILAQSKNEQNLMNYFQLNDGTDASFYLQSS